MRVLGMMSGTSADGIDVALARISGAPPKLSVKFEAHHHFRFPSSLRDTILRLANGATTTTTEISQLDFLLGKEFAAAAIAASKRWRVPLRRISLIGSHGQTVFHQGVVTRFAGTGRAASTLQIGEPSVIAERTGITTIADFRPASQAMEKEYRWLSAHRPAPFAWQAQDLHPSGAVGDATQASAEKGERLIDSGARAFCELLADIDRFDAKMLSTSAKI